MVYSPHVVRLVVFRADDGECIPPMEIDVLTSPAVHAGLVCKLNSGAKVEAKIARGMHARMARILFLLERREVRTIALGSFGTSVFKNDADTIATIWAAFVRAVQGFL
ncbi:hypothetical protein DFH09DRAFT_1204737 [Mycena vulgaris]|nr:hypothetical protein DFH09DRAFT_1204737 [Mycena vulgaris]